MRNKHRSAALLLGLAALSCLECPTASAAPVGVRIYVDLWDPQHPAANSFQTFFDDPTLISRNISDAWNGSIDATTSDVVNAMTEHDIGGGFRTYDASVVLHPIENFSITPTRGGGALIQATIPQISITSSFRTPGPAPSGTDPRFTANGDLLVSVDLEFGGAGKVLQTASVSAVIRNLNGPTPLNDSAKIISDAADIANAMIEFVIGWDLKQMFIASLTSQDLTKKRFQPQIDENLKTLNAEFSAIPNVDSLLARRVWADNNRLTLYVAPKPLPNVLQTGTMSGRISWNPSVVRGQCGGVNIAASVQLGPAPLLSSDATSFGPAPVMNVGNFQATPVGLSSCAYTMTQLGTGLPNALQASTSLGAVDVHASSSPYTGNLHSSTAILPDGWDGAFVTPNASNMNYVVIAGVSQGNPVGKLKQEEERRILNPGEERTVAPGVSNQVSPASKIELNPQPLPPKILKGTKTGTGQ